MARAVARLLRAIVRNDAMREDPTAIYNGRVLALVCAACFGGMLFGWDTGAIGGILHMPATQARFGFLDSPAKNKADLEQNIVSTLQAGCFLACFITGWAADRFGRLRVLVAAGVLTTIGVVLQAASAARGTLAVMYVGRFVAGLGCGAASALTPVYVSECAPRAIRGGLTGFYQLFNVFGIMVAFWVNYGCLLHVPAPAQYVIPLALQSLPAILLIVGMTLSPESPRWLAKEDNWEEATATLSRLRDLPPTDPYVQAEIQEMADQLEIERRLTGGSSPKALFREMFFIPGNRNRALISIMLMICQQLTGVNAINYYAPQLFANLGMDATNSSLFATGIYGVVKVISCSLFLLFVADSLGRRRSLIATAGSQGVVLFIIGIYGRVQPPVKGQPVTAFGYVAITCIYLWAASFQFGWGPACWILVSEIPTARLRALNVSVAAATQWLFNFVAARTVLTMQSTMGRAGYGMYFMFGSFCFLMGVFVYFFVPETKGLSLEKMDELFGVTDAFHRKFDGDSETGRHTPTIDTVHEAPADKEYDRKTRSAAA
ncbi:General substrate transporter [Cordyceps militaris]|uniref:General substrate transporter n=1 Tax=Cordyceps militaris TaxID=73501 RepID=A0A2H4SIH6_CORMI|nr:General substrate transporter [Cordyceps militaris]